MAYNFSKKTVLQAIEKSRGITEVIAKRLDCSWHAAKKAIDKYPEAQQAVLNERERSLDFAEGVILDAIAQKDVSTAKWYLSMKGKERGYIQDNVLKIDNNEPLNISLDHMTKESLQASEFVEINNGEEENTEQ